MLSDSTLNLGSRFWLMLIIFWGFIALSILLIQQSLTNGDLKTHVVFSITLFVSAIVTCPVIKWLIHYFDWTNARNVSTWFYLVIACIVGSYCAAIIINVLLGGYYLLVGKASMFVFFWSAVYSTWLLMNLLMLLWTVIYVILVYSNKLSSMELKQSEAALKLKEAQLNSLIGQLNPHFLFNSLNNIRSLMLEDVSKSREVLTSLSDFLRYSLSNNNQAFQTIENELNIVRDYIALALVQYEERLDYHENIDESLLAYKVPPMLIQLLVENAIRHGIDRCQGIGKLGLTISRCKHNIIIDVVNPGDLKQKFAINEQQRSTGLGIKNIKQRLNLLFNEQASFNLSEDNGVVKAEVIFPLKKHNDTQSQG
jgi:sensor histidine kinase YesM